MNGVSFEEKSENTKTRVWQTKRSQNAAGLKSEKNKVSVKRDKN